MMVLIRKRAHFTDSIALPFRDTGFSAQKGVSLQGVRRNFAEYAHDTGFLTEKGCVAVGTRRAKRIGRENIREEEKVKEKKRKKRNEKIR